MSTKNPKKHNSFFYFLRHKKGEIEKRMGRSIDLSELAQCVSAEWEAMSQAQKMKYQEMAAGKRQTAEKLNSLGVPLRVKEDMERRKAKENEDMIKYIEHLVGTYRCHVGVERLSFYIISTSVYTCTDEGVLVPAELSVIRCSFLDGITKELHSLFKADIPAGYMNEALEHADMTHNLLPRQNGPVREERERLSRTGTEVHSLLQEFLTEVSHHHLIAYTLSIEQEQTEKILLQLTGGEQLQISGMKLKIYSLEVLFQSMCSFIGKVSLHQVTGMITQSWYDYHPGIACTVHNLNEGGSMMHCTLARVRRWMYLMCQHIDVCKNFGVTPVRGKHCPLEEDAQVAVMNLPEMMFVTDEAVVWKDGLGAADMLQQQEVRGKIMRTSSPLLAASRGTVTRQEGLNSPSTISCVSALPQL